MNAVRLESKTTNPDPHGKLAASSTNSSQYTKWCHVNELAGKEVVVWGGSCGHVARMYLDVGALLQAQLARKGTLSLAAWLM